MPQVFWMAHLKGSEILCPPGLNVILSPLNTSSWITTTTSLLTDQKNDFYDYQKINFEDRGYSVWNVENDAEMTCRVKFIQRNDKSRICDLSGRPDFIITPSKRKSDGVVTTKADRLFCAVCIIVVQSKHRDKDIPLCEVLLQLYLMLVMIMYALPTVVGFLVQDDGMCRTYKAIRLPESIMYEQNDLVHVSHIAEVFRVLWKDGHMGCEQLYLLLSIRTAESKHVRQPADIAHR